MSRRLVFLLAAFALGCAPTGVVGGPSSSSGSSGGLAPLPACGDCFDDSNCQSGICVQLGEGDGSCLPACADGCASGATCQTLGDVNGSQQSACVPQSGACGDPATGKCAGGCGVATHCDFATGACVADGSSSSSSGSSSGTTGSGDCGSYAAPSTPASCGSCTPASRSDCQANHCYGGWYCATETGSCVSPQTACGGGSTGTSGSSGSSGTSGTSGGTSTGSTTAGAPWTGSVTKSGGSVNRLYFAAVGDCRPPSVDETSQYPTAIIQKIFSDMASLTVKPQFAVATGDYMYASPSGSAGATQIQKFASAASAFPGVLFAALGNHECTGYTKSNCGSGSADGVTANYTDFMNTLVQPLGQTKPYYRFDVNDSAGRWTAKFLVLAMNAWNSTQSSWLTTQVQQPTTYTFIIRHEPEDATTAPGVSPSDAIIDAHPYTLKIVGHTHEFYYRSGSRQVIVGNGGAPLSGSQTYGYALVQMLADGNIQIDNYNYQSNAPVNTVVVPK